MINIKSIYMYHNCLESLLHQFMIQLLAIILTCLGVVVEGA